MTRAKPMAPASKPAYIACSPMVAVTLSTDSTLKDSGREPYLSCRDRVSTSDLVKLPEMIGVPGDDALDLGSRDDLVVQDDGNLIHRSVVVGLLGQGRPPVLAIRGEGQGDDPAALGGVVAVGSRVDVLPNDLRDVEQILGVGPSDVVAGDGGLVGLAIEPTGRCRSCSQEIVGNLELDLGGQDGDLFGGQCLEGRKVCQFLGKGCSHRSRPVGQRLRIGVGIAELRDHRVALSLSIGVERCRGTGRGIHGGAVSGGRRRAVSGRR